MGRVNIWRNFFSRGLCGYGSTSQEVDGVLHNNGSNGGNGVFKAHGKADVGQLFAVVGGKAQLIFSKAQAVSFCSFGEEPPGTEQAAEGLADYSSDGCSVYSHSERND